MRKVKRLACSLIAVLTLTTLFVVLWHLVAFNSNHENAWFPREGKLSEGEPNNDKKTDRLSQELLQTMAPSGHSRKATMETGIEKRQNNEQRLPSLGVYSTKRNHGYGSTTGSCLSWCSRGRGAEPPYFLTAVLLVRIYREDLPQLSTRELLQWLYYLRYAGVEHVYIYDAYHKPQESQKNALRGLINEGYVTYTDWSAYGKPYGIAKTQLSAYQHCITQNGREFKWQTAIDIDEYPFSPLDTTPGFMSRFVKAFSEKHSDIAEITMANFLFLGKPKNDAKHFMLVDRIFRRTRQGANALVKPIYQPSRVSSAMVHHNILADGGTMDAPEDELRMNHYWGARLQDWGEDTPKVIAMTTPDDSIKVIVKGILKCEDCIRSAELHRKRWN